MHDIDFLLGSVLGDDLWFVHNGIDGIPSGRRHWR